MLPEDSQLNPRVQPHLHSPIVVREGEHENEREDSPGTGLRQLEDPHLDLLEQPKPYMIEEDMNLHDMFGE